MLPPLAGAHPEESLLELAGGDSGGARTKQTGKTRASSACYVTGAPRSECEECWVFPPECEQWISGRDEEPGVVPFDGVGNVIVLRKDLVTLYRDNAFGIDVVKVCVRAKEAGGFESLKSQYTRTKAESSFSEISEVASCRKRRLGTRARDLTTTTCASTSSGVCTCIWWADA